LNRGRFLPLSDVNSLISLFTGSILETADLDALVVKHGAEVYAQAKNQQASSSDISKSLYGRLSSSTNIDTFTVEDIYAANAQGDQNVQVWLNAEQMDSKTTSQIKDVSLLVFVGSAKHHGWCRLLVSASRAAIAMVGHQQ
jgi:hypothetical protein